MKPQLKSQAKGRPSPFVFNDREVGAQCQHRLGIDLAIKSSASKTPEAPAREAAAGQAIAERDQLARS